MEKTDNYKVEEIRTIKDLKNIFSEEESENAWLFLSTEGYHGTKFNLDDLEYILRDEGELTASINGRYWITILVVYPQRVSANVGVCDISPLLKYGEIMIDIDDIAWLRETVRSTLKKVENSQYGNL
jgi:hypothetical protein